jgi:hypothetical protein
MKMTEALGFPVDEIGIWPVVPFRAHPQADAIDKESVAWAVRHNLCAPDSANARSRFGGVLADCMPFGNSEKVLGYACYGLWANLWDDHLDTLSTNPVELGLHIAEVLLTADRPVVAPVRNDKWLIGLRDVRRLWEECMDQADVECLVARHAEWVAGQLSKAMLMRRPTPPTVEEVLRMRLAKAGLGSITAITAITGGYPLNANEYADLQVRAFAGATYLTATLLNEILGQAKELLIPETGRTNLVSALMHERTLDRTAATLAAWELYERAGCLALALQSQLQNDPRPNIASLAAQLPQWIPAALHYMTNAARYLEIPGYGTLTPPTISLASAPVLWDRENLTPLPFPDIAWWWDQLGR